MKNKHYHWLLAGIMAVMLISCGKDFISVDLSKKSVTVMSPPDNYQTTTLTQTFWWDKLDGATDYRLQIVKPSFSYVQQLVLDTSTSGTKYIVTLSPGTYQWRLRAENNTSNTDYVTRTLVIDSTTNLSTQSLVLNSPADNYVTSQMNITFKWDTLYNANEYRLQIIDQSTNGIVTDVTLQTDSFSYALNEGTFKWQVRAQNATSNSLYTARTITIDTTAPDVPTIVTPANGDTTTSPATLTWSTGTTGGSAIQDSVYVYSDSLMTSVVKDTLTASTSYSVSLTSGNYFWKVRSIDAAGNKSGYSQLSKFIVQ